MQRGGHKCIVSVQNKGEEDPIFVPPDFFEKTFFEIGVTQGAEITLFEFKGNLDEMEGESNGDEAGEEEVEELEGEEPEEAQNEDEQPAQDQEKEEEQPGEAEEEARP